MDVNSARIAQPMRRSVPYRGEASPAHSRADKTTTAHSAPATHTAQPARHTSPAASAAIQAVQSNPTSVWKHVLLIVGGILLAVALVAGGYFLSSRNNAVVAPYSTDKYQAVFLSGGQVYFGKIKGIDNDYLKLNDVFYIQSNSSKTDTKNTDADKTEGGNMQLIKLGDEVHGPEDSMTVNRSQVLFFEDLKPDSKVVKLIEQYQQSNK